MKKEIGKWFLDIAKYVATAGLISSLFGEIKDKTAIYIVASVIILLCLSVGLFFVKEGNKK